MTPSIWQILIIVALIILLFGRNKISELMADTAKGIKSFRKGLSDDEDTEDEESQSKAVPHQDETSSTATAPGKDEEKVDR